MIRRPTATFGLSYLFVAMAALVLRGPSATPEIPRHGVEPGRSEAPTVSTEPGPGVTSLPMAEDQFALPPPPAKTRRPSPSRSPSVVTPVQWSAHRVAGPARPRSPFTRAGAGETVGEVARRVYGDPAYAREIWLANRDSLRSAADRLDSPTLLRTPAIRSEPRR
jgi:nucleoid-associated protein YgaU